MGCGSSKNTVVSASVGSQKKKETKQHEAKIEPARKTKGVQYVNVFDVLNGLVNVPKEGKLPDVKGGRYADRHQPSGTVLAYMEAQKKVLVTVRDTFWEKKKKIMPELNKLENIQNYVLQVVLNI